MSTRVKLFLMFCAVAVLFLPVSADQELYFSTFPCISPDGGAIVFVYEGDLWKVSVHGGVASRMTGMEGTEVFPRFSPDGKWLAFSASQDGNLNVYIMPVNGGDIRQLTFHSSVDIVDSWSWDSSAVYFNSNRFNNFTQFSVGIQGGTPVRMFGILEDLNAALGANDPDAIRGVLVELESLEQMLQSQMIKVGGRQQDVDWTTSLLQQRDTQLRSKLSLERDADVAQVSADLAAAQNSYQSSLLVASKLFQQNLMMYL